MKFERRQFLKSGILASTFLAGACGNSSNEEISRESSESFEIEDQIAHDFWAENNDLSIDNLISDTNHAVANTSTPTEHTPVLNKINARLPAGEGRIPTFLIYTADKGFRVPSEVSSDELIPSGDTNVRIHVSGFKPSVTDREIFKRMRGGSLRIDVQQQPSTNIPAFVWSAVAALLAKDGKLPDLPNLKLDLGTLWGDQLEVPLPGGKAAWRWNFFSQKEESMWSKVIKMFGMGAKNIFPILGLPSIALSAFEQFNKFFAAITANKNSEWIFNANQIPVASTKRAYDDLARQDTLPLIDRASYIVVPQGHLSSFGKERKDLEFSQAYGYVVPKGTSATDVYAVAPKTVENVSYIALNLNVQTTK